eukprot:9148936-Pyramimonas_sp.AAC.1
MCVETQQTGLDSFSIRGRLQEVAGPATNLHAGWDLIRKSGIDLDPLIPYSQYFGCGQQARDVPQNVFDERMSTIRPMLPSHSDK